MADMIVSGAENSTANGTYVESGTLNGRPKYLKGALPLQWINVSWQILSGDYSVWYESSDDVATPDLVTSWLDFNTFAVSSLVVTADGGGGGDDYTLTCAAGSYSLTGTNVTLTATVKQNLTLACNAGTYSLTGTNADLTVTRHYTLSVGGAYPDMIVANAEISAANGTYVETGTYDGRPKYIHESNVDWLLQYEGGVWAMYDSVEYTFFYFSFDDVATPDLCSSWIDVNNDYAPSALTVTAANAYKLTGTDATLTVQRNYTLVCEAGSYALTGTDATFNANYVFALGMGSYVLVGTNADLTVTYSAGGVPKQYLHYARLRSN